MKSSTTAKPLPALFFGAKVLEDCAVEEQELKSAAQVIVNTVRPFILIIYG